MSLHLQSKLKKENDSAEKYLKFLMATYVALSGGYTSFKIGAMLGQHKVDKHTFSGLVSLGWVVKLSTESGVKYYWRGPVPTLDNVDEVKKAISKYKNKTSIVNPAPVSKSGKLLIPIVKEIKEVKTRAKTSSSLDRYCAFLKELKLMTKDYSQVDVANLVMVHQISKGAFTSAVRLGVLIKDKKPYRKAVYYKWNPVFSEVNNELAQKILTDTTLQVRNSILTKKGLTVQDNNVNLVESVKIDPVKETSADTKFPIENKNLNKEFAMKLFALGYVEDANKVLDSLIKKQ